MKYDIVVGEEDKHMVELEHFNQERAVQYAEQYMSFGTRRINNTLGGITKLLSLLTFMYVGIGVVVINGRLEWSHKRDV